MVPIDGYNIVKKSKYEYKSLNLSFYNSLTRNPGLLVCVLFLVSLVRFGC